jgi:acyl dehydratase
MKIGDVARRTRQVQQEDIELFASMTGDRNPVHFDPELAARSRLAGSSSRAG